MNVEVRAQVCSKLNIMMESISDTYHRLPSMLGLDHSDSLSQLIERFLNRLEGCMEKLLSLAVRKYF